MKYIIFDLEFNQSLKSENKVQELPFEIIQIGALKLNESFETISEFNMLIKPKVYKTVHPYVQELTKITDEMIASANGFDYMYSEFLKFIENDDVTFVTWGTADLRELYKNIIYFNLSSENLPKSYIDIQQYASKYFNAPSNSRIGLRNAIDFLNIPINIGFHDAFNDAYYTSEVFKKLFTNEIEVNLYSHSPSRKQIEQKKIVDYAALINQFEKMYDRKLASDEIDMIKLAYVMGKTNQFLINK